MRICPDCGWKVPEAEYTLELWRAHLAECPGEHPPYQPHSETSKSAATSIAVHTRTLRTKVLQFLQDRGAQGATDEEMITVLGGDARQNALRPRRVELLEQKQIYDSGFRRPTRSGRQAVVWVAHRRIESC